MSKRASPHILTIDWLTVCLYAGLVVIGWLMVYAVNYEEGNSFWQIRFNTSAGKQGVFIGISFVLLLVLSAINQRFWRTFAYLAYAIGLLLLVLVLFIGVSVNGATSWFDLKIFYFQPAEIAKFATCLAIASYLSAYNTDLRNPRHQLVVASLFMAPMLLILLQPDAGSALVFLSFLLVLYRAGLSANLYIFGFSSLALFILGLVYPPLYIILSLVACITLILIFSLRRKLYALLGFIILAATSLYLLGQGMEYAALLTNLGALVIAAIAQQQQRRSSLVYLLVVALLLGSAIPYGANYAFNNLLASHQQDRIKVWLKPSECDPQGPVYNVRQSKVTIGSGGLKGRGFLEGTMTKLNYVPEQATDFIFCTVGEEQGFVGSFGVIALFSILLIRIITLAERQRNEFARYYAYGVAGIIFTHFFVNIGMTMGLVPIIGIPLPFISYGGSSLIGFTLLIGVLLRLDSERFRG